jgi:hypothetical protein
MVQEVVIHNKRHVFSVSGMPVGTTLWAMVNGSRADEMVGADGTTSYMFVEHSYPLVGWENRGVMLNADEGDNIDLIAVNMSPPIVVFSALYQYGGYSEVDVSSFSVLFPQASILAMAVRFEPEPEPEPEEVSMGHEDAPVPPPAAPVAPSAPVAPVAPTQPVAPVPSASARPTAPAPAPDSE